MGKILITLGAILILTGLILLYADRIPYLGRLPGDLRIERNHFTFYFPLTTCLLLSLLASLVLYLISRFKG